MECILVWHENGNYDYIPDAPEEFWEDVLYDCDNFQHIEKLKGWGKYTDSYQVTINGKTVFYFVVMPQW